MSVSLLVSLSSRDPSASVSLSTHSHTRQYGTVNPMCTSQNVVLVDFLYGSRAMQSGNLLPGAEVIDTSHVNCYNQIRTHWIFSLTSESQRRGKQWVLHRSNMKAFNAFNFDVLRAQAAERHREKSFDSTTRFTRLPLVPFSFRQLLGT